jgi:uncharacterized protein (TIGR03083 family)
MNAQDVLNYGHQTVLHTLKGVPADQWTTPGVCGWWSVKDIVAHLASYEGVLVDVLRSLQDGDAPTPTLDRFRNRDEDFNDTQVAQRQEAAPEAVLEEYRETCRTAQTLLAEIPASRRREAGLLPWYGSDYDLEDYIAYAFYGHKREHSAQIAVFIDRLKSGAA